MRRAPAFTTGEDPAYYALLGVPSSATQEEIAAAYRSLMRRYHPDASGGGEGADEMAKRVNEAFSVVGHPDLRAEYDAVHGYPRVEELLAPVAAKPTPPRPPTAPRREPSFPASEEQGVSAMMVFATFIAAAAVVLVIVLIALAREQRAVMAQPAAVEAPAQEPRQR